MKFPKVKLKGIPGAGEILRQARVLVENKEKFCVCWAVRAIGEKPGCKYVNSVIADISASIEPHQFVTLWAKENNVAIEDSWQYRIAWIDHMLKELENDR